MGSAQSITHDDVTTTKQCLQNVLKLNEKHRFIHPDLQIIFISIFGHFQMVSFNESTHIIRENSCSQYFQVLLVLMIQYDFMFKNRFWSENRPKNC